LLVSQGKVFDQVLTLTADLAEDCSAMELVCIKSVVLFFWFFSFARAKEKKEEKNDIASGNDTYWKTLPNSRSSFNIIIKGDYKNI